MSTVTADVTGWHGEHFYLHGYSLCNKSTVLSMKPVEGSAVTPIDACRRCLTAHAEGGCICTCGKVHPCDEDPHQWRPRDARNP